MTEGRWVLLGLAPARAEWFRDVTRWVNSAALPAEFVKCLSAEEVRARLASGRRWSALLIDVISPGFDRDLVATARAAGASVVAVHDGPAPGWAASEIGVVAVLPAAFGREDLLDVLAAHAGRVAHGDVLPVPLGDPAAPAWRGRLVTVCGPGGTGASTVAAAVAQGLAADVRYGGGVVLADLALRADQAMLHDAADLGPGIQELVERHRLGRPDAAEVAGHTFEVPARRYRLLLGLRRPGAWAALRPRAVDAALDGLRRTFPAVVADVTGDVDGEAQCGSVEVEERNHLARSATGGADVVLAVGSPGLKGVHSLASLLRALAAHGVAAHRLVTVVNRAPRDPRSRAEVAAALARLAPGTTATSAPVWVRERKLESHLRSGAALPDPLVAPLAGAVTALLDRAGPPAATGTEPVAIAPGSLGAWSDGSWSDGA